MLELSGIGALALLQSLGISVAIGNANVGENVQDHLMTAVSFEVKDGVPTGDGLIRQEPDKINEAIELFNEHKAGPLTVGGIGFHAYG